MSRRGSFQVFLCEREAETACERDPRLCYLILSYVERLLIDRSTPNFERLPFHSHTLNNFLYNITLTSAGPTFLSNFGTMLQKKPSVKFDLSSSVGARGCIERYIYSSCLLQCTVKRYS